MLYKFILHGWLIVCIGLIATGTLTLLCLTRSLEPTDPFEWVAFFLFIFSTLFIAAFYATRKFQKWLDRKYPI